MKKSTIVITTLTILLILILLLIFIDIPEGTQPLESEITSEALKKDKNTETLPTNKNQTPCPVIKESTYEPSELKKEYTYTTKTIGKITSHTLTTDSGIYSMRYLPEEVQDIPSPSTIQLKDIVYVTRDHNFDDLTNDLSSIAAIEFGRFVPGFEASYTTANADTKQYNLFVKTCNDITSTEAVFKMQLGDQNAAYYLDDCLIIQGKNPEGLVKTADKVAYTLLEFF